ncbi:uncharacterized protein [Spinacia oleracea]|uniref:Reverse transcriptase domain-containing protein n=1 Tax=Spinacia oleracea TaxID=3562 RepID=A0ABM3QRA3_SPIOL|nr:uncharacterized protein LOC110793820 [Spinacia oleracea]
MEIPSIAEEVVPTGDVYTPKTDHTTALDDGWRVVSRRKREAKTQNIFLGLAQVHAVVADISEEEGEGEGEDEEGLNDPSKVGEVKRFAVDNKIVVFALLETRVKNNNHLKIQRKFGQTWRWEMNYSASPRGRIWVGWKHQVVTVHLTKCTEQLIHVDVLAKSGNFQTAFTAVYGLHSVETRRPLWTDLIQLSTVIVGPWLIMGDFNAVLYSGDRILSMMLKPEILRVVDFMNPGLSDHSPLLLNCRVEWAAGGRPFKIFNYMATHVDFLKIVQDGWAQRCTGSLMFSLWQKLKVVKGGLKTLHQKEFARLDEKIDLLRQELDEVQSELANDSTDTELQHKESASPHLTGIDIELVREVKQLSPLAAENLIQPVTNKGIDEALKGIDVNKAPGIDGLNGLFFRKAWDIVKEEVYAAVKNFFQTGHMLRMQPVIGEIVGSAQSGFIPGRVISDNILMATELSMLQDLGFPDKFVKWIMACLCSVSYSILVNGFPSKPIPAQKGLRQGDPMSPFLFAIGMEYLSRCLSSLNNSKGFRFHPRCKRIELTHLMFADDLLMFARGDDASVSLLFEAFSKFSAASGLEANMMKSELYLAGVPDSVAQSILAKIGIPRGSFPFKYLGVPLSTRKLSFTDCKPLIEKTVARVRSWSAKLLSYAGRLQLVRSVLFGIQLYWCQIFIMPKKVLKEIQRICRCFLWTGAEGNSRKALVAWDQLCLPKVCGGWNLKDLPLWNKSAVAKHCWALSLKDDKLWVKWIHTYYVKHNDFWTMPIPNGLSWSLKKIWQQRETLSSSDDMQKFVISGKFNIQRLYNHLRQQGESVRWKRIVCNSHASPKSAFIVWLALQDRLATKDRLRRWNIIADSVCSLCHNTDESRDHLFFECSYSADIWSQVLQRSGIHRASVTWNEEVHYSADIWSQVLQRSGIHRASVTWNEEVQWVQKASRSTTSKARLCNSLFCETVYSIYLARNSKIFSNQFESSLCIVNRILFRVACNS